MSVDEPILVTDPCPECHSLSDAYRNDHEDCMIHYIHQDPDVMSRTPYELTQNGASNERSLRKALMIERGHMKLWRYVTGTLGIPVDYREIIYLYRYRRDYVEYGYEHLDPTEIELLPHMMGLTYSHNLLDDDMIQRCFQFSVEHGIVPMFLECLARVAPQKLPDYIISAGEMAKSAGSELDNPDVPVSDPLETLIYTALNYYIDHRPQQVDIGLIVKLRELGCSWDALEYEKAVELDDLNLLKYLTREGLPLDGTLYKKAIKRSDVDIVKYLVEHQCPFVEGAILVENSWPVVDVERSIECIQIMLDHGYVIDLAELIKYLVVFNPRGYDIYKKFLTPRETANNLVNRIVRAVSRNQHESENWLFHVFNFVADGFDFDHKTMMCILTVANDKIRSYRQMFPPLSSLWIMPLETSVLLLIRGVSVPRIRAYKQAFECRLHYARVLFQLGFIPPNEKNGCEGGPIFRRMKESFNERHGIKE